jgi:cation diffusion facilitator family transporter
MKATNTFRLPPELEIIAKKATRLEWITVGYLATVVTLMYFVMGSSQAMKTAWLEDLLGLIPAISYLIAARIYRKPPNKDFPYGYHSVLNIASLAGALAILSMGIFLVIDSSITLFRGEHATVGSRLVFGYQIWNGWLMIAALVYSSVPAVVLGLKKLPLSKLLNHKILFVDAEAQKADYTTAFAAIVGVVGIGLGLWWADPVAALFIAFSVLKDGYENSKDAVNDLINQRPYTVDNKKEEMVEKIENFVRTWGWVEAVSVRFRKEGQVFFGEIFIVPINTDDLPAKIETGTRQLKAYHWQVHDVTLTVVNELPLW